MKAIFVLLFFIFFFQVHISEAISPKQTKRIELLKKEVFKHFKQGEYNQAIPLLKEILSINPNDKTAVRYISLANQQVTEPYCKEAAEAYHDGNYASAIETWDKILKMNPDDIRLEKMIEIIKNSSTEKSIDDMLAFAERLFKEGQHEHAITELEKILSIKPYDRHVREMLVSARKSVADITIRKHYDQAEIYMKQEKYDLAIEEWKKVVEIDENQEAASRLIAAAVREKMKSLYARASQLFWDGKYLSSRDHYYKIITDNPTDQDVKTVINRLDEVLTITSDITGDGLEWDMMRKALSNHIDTDGNKKVAIAASWYAVQLAPDNEIATTIKAFVERRYFSLLSSLDPPVGDMNIIDQYLFAALNHIYEGRYDRAIQLCSMVIDLQPENLLAWKRLGSAYFAIGKKGKAREAWEQALEISPDDKEIKKFMKQVK